MALLASFPTQQATGQSINDTRRIVAGMVCRNVGGAPRVGVLPAHTGALVAGLASMAYSVGVFNGVTSRAAPGAEFIVNDGATTVATTPAPAANSRIDVIWVKASFLLNADGTNMPVFGVTQGTAASIPTKPAIPAGALELATAEILSTYTTTATAVITQSYQMTAMSGGSVNFRNQTDQDGFAAADGQRGFRLDTGQAVIRRSGAWALADGTDAAWLPLTLMTGWSAVGGHAPRAKLMNGVIYIEGAVSRGMGGALNAIAKMPDSLKHPGNKTVFYGSAAALKGATVANAELYVSPVGSDYVIRIESYNTFDSGIGWTLPLGGSYVYDQR